MVNRRRFVSSKIEYFTIHARYEDITVSWKLNISYEFEYSVNGAEWERGYSVFLSKGDDVRMRRKTSPNERVKLVADGRFDVSGDIWTLIFSDKQGDKSLYEGSSVFASAFASDAVVDASKLQLGDKLYALFSLMFVKCDSLVKAPELPARTLIESCYRGMFEGCNNLKYIKMLATDISASGCLESWVSGVASVGTFVKSPEATWEVYGDSGIPNGWYVFANDEPLTFTYDGKTYETGYGMTWEEYVASEYNDGKFSINAYGNVVTGRIPVTLNGIVVTSADMLIAGVAYSSYSSGGRD